MLFSELSKLSPAEEEEEDESEESVETESFDSEASLGSVAMPEARSTTEYEFWKGKVNLRMRDSQRERRLSMLLLKVPRGGGKCFSVLVSSYDNKKSST